MSGPYEPETTQAETTAAEMTEIIKSDFKLRGDGEELVAWVIVAMVGMRCPDPTCGQVHMVPMSRSNLGCDLATARVLSEMTTALIDGAAQAGGHVSYDDEDDR